jgi:glycosyltransferase involved in cell wall biosynthesis
LNQARVELLGTQPQDRLNAIYAAADLFLCMSEHEGFCIPLLEAMAHDVPVLAYAAGAVEETLDGAGVLFREKRWPVIAALMDRLTRDLALRGAVVKTQRDRLERYRARDPDAELRALLAPWLS